jgi:hypothetical protein
VNRAALGTTTKTTGMLLEQSKTRQRGTRSADADPHRGENSVILLFFLLLKLGLTNVLINKVEMNDIPSKSTSI